MKRQLNHMLVIASILFLAQSAWPQTIPDVTISNSCYTVVFNGITINGTNTYEIPVCPNINFTFAADMTVTLHDCSRQYTSVVLGYQAPNYTSGNEDDWGYCIFSDAGGSKRYGVTTTYVEFQVRGPQEKGYVPLFLALNGGSCTVGSQADNLGWHLDESHSLHQFAILEVGSPTLIVESSSNGGSNPPPSNPWVENGANISYTDGSVGIGTANPSPDFALSVNGSTRTKRVVVESGWADHVFEPGYPLPTLDSVRAFIDANGHLPGIPSASEIEQKGLDVGAVQREMMAKIEELTLYMLHLQAENERLRRRVEKLEGKTSEKGGQE